MVLSNLVNAGKTIMDLFNQEDAQAMKQRLEDSSRMKLLKEEEKTIQTTVKAQSDIIIAEASGESYIQRSWRPLLMVSFGIIIFIAYGLFPIINSILTLFHVGEVIKDTFMVTQIPNVVIPTEMWNLLSIGVGGYIVGRSVEKSVDRYKNGR